MVEVGRDRQALVPEVPGDRGRARVEAAGGELRPQGDDPIAHVVGCSLRARVRPPGPRLQIVKATLPVPPQETVQVPAADPALGRGGGDGQL